MEGSRNFRMRPVRIGPAEEDATYLEADSAVNMSHKRKLVAVARTAANITTEGGETSMVVAGSEPVSRSNQDNFTYFDYNLYAVRKSISTALLDVALLMANASQLKSVYLQGHANPFYAPMISLLSLSIIFQILVGIAIIVLSKININVPDEKMHKVVAGMTTTVIVLVFLLTLVNVFIAALGITYEDQRSS